MDRHGPEHGATFGRFAEVLPDVGLRISPTPDSCPDMLAKVNVRISAGDHHRGHLRAAPPWST